MRIIGFHFKKIGIEKLKENAENIKIRTDIDIPEIKEIKQSILKTKEDLLEINFEYNINYEPDFARIELKGVVLLSSEPKIAKEILKNWKKKEIPEDIRMQLFNLVLRKSTLKALELEEQLGLPLHMPMPSFKKGQEGK